MSRVTVPEELASRMNITIIGDGGWGTALALVLRRNGHAVTVWGPFANYLDEVRAARENRKFLPGVTLPPEIALTADPAAAVAGAEAFVFAMPSRFYRPVLSTFAPLLPKGALCLSVSKGLDRETHRRLTEVAEEVLGNGPVAALSGPSHA